MSPHSKSVLFLRSPVPPPPPPPPPPYPGRPDSYCVSPPSPSSGYWSQVRSWLSHLPWSWGLRPWEAAQALLLLSQGPDVEQTPAIKGNCRENSSLVTGRSEQALLPNRGSSAQNQPAPWERTVADPTEASAEASLASLCPSLRRQPAFAFALWDDGSH